jgi:hypothetical protein
MGGCCLLKYNGGDSEIKIAVLYSRCPLIRVSVNRGSSIETAEYKSCVLTGNKRENYIVLTYGMRRCVYG